MRGSGGIFELLCLCALALLPLCTAVCTAPEDACDVEIGALFPAPAQGDQDGFLTFDTGGKKYVRFVLMPPVNAELEFAVSLLYGSVEIYIKEGDHAPTEKDYDFTSHKSAQTDVVSMSADALNVDKRKSFTALIKGISESKFKVLLSTGDATQPVYLSDGLVVRDSVSDTTRSSYVYTVPAGATSSFVVAVTPFSSGDPTLWIMADNEEIHVSDKAGADYIAIDHAAKSKNTNYEIFVYANGSSTFTVVASPATKTAPTLLLGGYPQTDFLKANQWRHYVLEVPAGGEDVIISVTPVTGDPNLYVNPPSKGFYDGTHDATWSSTKEDGLELIMISSGAPDFVADGGRYFITVHSSAESEFVVSGFSANTVVTIREGVPFVDMVSEKGYHYYRYFNDKPDKAVQFALSPMSGDPDLYIGCRLLTTGNDDGYPSRKAKHYSFSSAVASEDTLSIAPDDPKACTANGVYYIAVYGYRTASYTLDVMHEGGTVTLHSGMLQVGRVFKRMSQQYEFRMGAEAEELIITLTTQSGDADIFVRMYEPASTWEYDYSSMHSDQATDVIRIPETEVCTHCWISVLVYGFETSRYTILAHTEDTIVTLVDSLPQQGSVATDKIQGYTYRMSVDGEMTITMTKLTGTPVLLATKEQFIPDMNSENTIIVDPATTGVVPQVTLTGLKQGDHVHFGVYGNENSTYTLRAYGNSGVTELSVLLSDFPQADKLAKEKWHYYQYYVDAGHDNIKIRSSIYSGDVDLYVQVCPFQSYSCVGHEFSPSYLPDQNSYLVSSDESTIEESVLLERVDEAPVSYIVGIYAVKDSQYTLSVGMEKAILMLQPGVSVTDHVREKQWSYFKFYVPEPRTHVLVSVTPQSGDPDVFVSTQYQMPNMTHYTWREISWGDDDLEINVGEDEKACHNCFYYIGVYGFMESTYVISVSLSSTVTHLYPGIPMEGSVGTLAWRQYVFYNDFGDQSDFRVTLTPSSGDTDLYVTLNGDEPSMMRSDYHSLKWSTAEDSVVIRRTDQKYIDECISDGDCEIRIGIFGVISSSFTIVVSPTASSTRLVPGVAQPDQVNLNKNNYYNLQLLQAGATVKVSVTPSSGHTTLYASCSQEMPSEEKNDWALSSDDGFTLTIPGDSAKCTAPATLYLAVFGRTMASYSIVARVEDDGAPPLMPGIQQSDSVQHRKFDYFIMRLGSDRKDVHITATALPGDVDLYVSATWEKRPVLKEGDTEVTSYLFKSAGFGNEFLVIPQEQLPECSRDCYLVLGVFGASTDNSGISEYTVWFSMENTITRLVNGVPTRDSVAHRGYRYYSFSANEPNKDVIISVTSFSGDPDLFVNANNWLPSTNNYTWGTAAWGTDTLTIQTTDPSLHCVPAPDSDGCVYSIAVYGWRNSSYSITATLDDGWHYPIRLLSGQPQTGSIEQGAFRYYRFRISQEIQSAVTVSLNPLDDSDQDLYVIFGEDGEPGPNKFHYKSTRWSGIDEITVTPSMEHFCNDCFLYIAVNAYRTGHYSITASQMLTSLQDGVSVAGVVTKDQYRYYTFYHSQPEADFRIDLTSLTGDPDVYIGKSLTQFPTKDSYLWRGFHFGDDSVVVSHTDKQFCYDCNYVVGVNGWQDATFTIMATTSVEDVITLPHGRPQMSSVAAGQMRYFKALVTNSAQTVSLSATVMGSGDLDLYVTWYSAKTTTPPALPDPANSATFKKTSAGLARDIVEVDQAFSEESIILIGVKGVSDAQFSLVASFTELQVMLQAGIPQEHFVKANTMAYFTFHLDEKADLQISLTAITGDPDLLASAVKPFPKCERDDPTQQYLVTCKDYTWKSAAYSTDQMILAHDAPCKPLSPTTTVAPDCGTSSLPPGTIHIGVYGYKDSRFSIMASMTGKHVAVVAGRPQLGSTALGYACSQRDNGGTCVSDDKTKTQAAYFSFRLSNTADNTARGQVAFTVLPRCNADPNSNECAPGCACNPLKLYVMSCPESKCTDSKMYPSQMRGTSLVSKTISTAGSTIFIQKDPSNSANGYCDPATAGEACMYFVAVSHTELKKTASFTFLATATEDITLIPCDTSKKPDGVRLTKSDAVTDQMKYYELCSQATEAGSTNPVRENTVVQLEQCSGESSLVACDETCDALLPTKKDYTYFSDAKQTCKRGSDGKQTCSTNTLGQPTVSLPEDAERTYFMGVDGRGSYMLKLLTTSGGVVTSPALAADGKNGQPVIEVVKKGDSSVTLAWTHAAAKFPGLDKLLRTNKLTYTVYIIDSSQVDQEKAQQSAAVLTTACGLEYFGSTQGAAVRSLRLTPPSTSSSRMEQSFAGLKPSTSYQFQVVASCDSDCLRQLSRTSASGAKISCDSTQPCAVTNMVYSPTSAETKKEEDSNSGGGGASNGFVVLLSVITTVLVVGAAIAGFMYYRMKRQDSAAQYTMESADEEAPAVTMSFPYRTKIFMKNKSAYQPLLNTDQEFGTPDGEEETSVLL